MNGNLPAVDDAFVAKLRDRLNRPEDKWVERKSTPKGDERDIRKTLVAFANSVDENELAVLFLGASNNGQHPGVTDADELQRKIRIIAKEQCYPPIQYCPVPMPIDLNGKTITILAVVVPSSANRPHFSGLAYIREGSESIEASAKVFAELIASQNETTRCLQRMKGPIDIQVRSDSGFWYQFEGRIEKVDAHSLTVKNGEGYFWPVPVSGVKILTADPKQSSIQIPPKETEIRHIQDMLHIWRFYRRQMDVNDYIVRQLLPHAKAVLPLIREWDDLGQETHERWFHDIIWLQTQE